MLADGSIGGGHQYPACLRYAGPMTCTGGWPAVRPAGCWTRWRPAGTIVLRSARGDPQRFARAWPGGCPKLWFLGIPGTRAGRWEPPAAVAVAGCPD